MAAGGGVLVQAGHGGRACPHHVGGHTLGSRDEAKLEGRVGCKFGLGTINGRSLNKPTTGKLNTTVHGEGGRSLSMRPSFV